MISDDYKKILGMLNIPTVRLGYGVINIYKIEEIGAAQVGYSIDPLGVSLVDGTPGSWQRKWFVIGYEEESADPIFIDTETENFPVYAAMHGSGSWEPTLIAKGLRNFATIMRDMSRLAEGRENPVRLETNPITAEERARALKEIRKNNIGVDI